MLTQVLRMGCNMVVSLHSIHSVLGWTRLCRWTSFISHCANNCGSNCIVSGYQDLGSIQAKFRATIPLSCVEVIYGDARNRALHAWQYQAFLLPRLNKGWYPSIHKIFCSALKYSIKIKLNKEDLPIIHRFQAHEPILRDEPLRGYADAVVSYQIVVYATISTF